MAGRARTLGLTRLRWSPEALSDFKGISAYVERKRNLAAANRVCRTIYDALHALRLHPRLGRMGRRAGTRELVIPSLPSYIAVYRVNGEVIELLHIWHGAQNWP